jgi:hypothetical protein
MNPAWHVKTGQTPRFQQGEDAMKIVSVTEHSRFTSRMPLGRTVIACLVTSILFMSARGNVVAAVEADWIWSPKHQQGQVPRQASCHFRKTFSVEDPERVQLVIAADDRYELHLNGKAIGTGRSDRELDESNVTRHIKPGRNTLAVKVTNDQGSDGALAVRLFVKQRGTGWVVIPTDETWRTNLHPLPFWNSTFYNDRFWAPAQSFGKLAEDDDDEQQAEVNQPDKSPRKPEIAKQREPAVGRDEMRSTASVGDEPAIAATNEKAEEAINAGEETEEQSAAAKDRFRISKQFRVQQVIEAEETGSLIAMAFNEFGQVIASREDGPLLLIVDTDNDKIVDDVRVYCDKVKNVQGILPLNGEVIVTADGPEGNGLYRLTDEDRDENLESVHTILRFTGEMGEHGAHGLTLGPDGCIYAVVGNHSAPTIDYAETSPHRGFYEGDLVGPRYEDPGGHAVGHTVPGGVILRLEVDGKNLQLITGGLRNAYDLAFNSQGELFVHDSDMESDQGTPWYRPTRICHVTPGAEFGWRSGWAKWPERLGEMAGLLCGLVARHRGYRPRFPVGGDRL